jgi:hypothetical protein
LQSKAENRKQCKTCHLSRFTLVFQSESEEVDHEDLLKKIKSLDKKEILKR